MNFINQAVFFVIITVSICATYILVNKKKIALTEIIALAIAGWELQEDLTSVYYLLFSDLNITPEEMIFQSLLHSIIFIFFYTDVIRRILKN